MDHLNEHFSRVYTPYWQGQEKGLFFFSPKENRAHNVIFLAKENQTTSCINLSLISCWRLKIKAVVVCEAEVMKARPILPPKAPNTSVLINPIQEFQM